MAFTVPALPYAYEALEPHIDKQTMQIHHDKHHQAYVDNLNKAIAGTENENKSIEELMKNAGNISPAVRNNGGGHWNHTFFGKALRQTEEARMESWLMQSMRHSAHSRGLKKNLMQQVLHVLEADGPGWVHKMVNW